MRRYSELVTLSSQKERFDYLRLNGVVGESTFGFERYLNQSFYKSKEWRMVRDFVIVRDCGHDMALPDPDFEIRGLIVIHHMNPITVGDISAHVSEILDPEFLVCVSTATHRAIHFGDEDQLMATEFVERKPGDTCLWR